MLGPKLRCVVSVSGIRGVIGDTLDVGQLLGLAQAFGIAIAHCERVVIGRDTRTTGPMLTQAVAAGLRSVGCEVVDIGIVPTPTLAIAVKELHAHGGIMISSSHNTSEWNALKLFNRDGRNVDQGQLDVVLECYQDPPIGSHRGWDGVGGFTENSRPRHSSFAGISSRERQSHTHSKHQGTSRLRKRCRICIGAEAAA